MILYQLEERLGNHVKKRIPDMENLNSEQFAHLNPDTECAAFEQV
jgi:hypothetical protein